MRLHFQRDPWDLYVAIGYTVATAGVLLALDVGGLPALLLVLFVPGYLLVAAIFPSCSTSGTADIDWIERIALSFGLSIAIVPLLGLLLNFTIWGIRFAPIVIAITLFSIGVGAVAYVRRMRLQPDERLSMTLQIEMPSWEQYGSLDKGLTIVLVAGIVVAGSTLAYVVLTPRPGESFTDFFILGPTGNASGYPTTLNVSQIGAVIVGIANHELTGVNYTLRIDLVNIQVSYNVTLGSNETVEINRTTWSTFNVTLAEGQKWTQVYTFNIEYPGLWKVQFLLAKEGGYSPVYRELHLFIRVM